MVAGPYPLELDMESQSTNTLSLLVSFSSLCMVSLIGDISLVKT
jgi:hypothetical protein